MKYLNKGLIFIFTLLLLGAIGGLIYITTLPKGEKLTEFYLLGLDGKADNYPKEMVIGEEGRVVVGIVNKEQASMSYRLSISINGTNGNEITSIYLEPEEKWEQIVGFNPTVPGDNQQVDFFLYKDEDTVPYLSLRLFVNVIP